MGIRESLLNTITSVADSDFVRIVTSAGASSKATVRNLFKGFESNLGAKSSLTTSDYIRVVGSDNEAYKQSVSAVKTAMGIDTLQNKFVSTYCSASGSFDLAIENDKHYLITMMTSSNASARVILISRRANEVELLQLGAGSWQSYFTESISSNTWHITCNYYTTIKIVVL